MLPTISYSDCLAIMLALKKRKINNLILEMLKCVGCLMPITPCNQGCILSLEKKAYY